MREQSHELGALISKVRLGDDDDWILMSWWMLICQSIMHKAMMLMPICNSVDVENVAPPTIKLSDVNLGRQHCGPISN